MSAAVSRRLVYIIPRTRIMQVLFSNFFKFFSKNAQLRLISTVFRLRNAVFMRVSPLSFAFKFNRTFFRIFSYISSTFSKMYLKQHFLINLAYFFPDFLDKKESNVPFSELFALLRYTAFIKMTKISKFCT